MRKGIGTYVKIKSGFYKIVGQPKSLIWLETEGPDKGSWFFDLGRGIGAVSEPYPTLAKAVHYALKAITDASETES